MNKYTRIYSLWIGDEIPESNIITRDLNMKYFPKYYFLHKTRKDFSTLDQLIPKNASNVLFSDLARIELLSSNNVYIDLDFKILNCDFDKFLLGNDLCAESPFVFANGFLHLQSYEIRKQYSQSLFRNLNSNNQLPHIITGPFALTRFVCSRVWEKKEKFNIVSNRKIFILPTFIDERILKLHRVDYAYSASRKSSWAVQSSSNVDYGVLKSLIWYATNQTPIPSPLIFLLRYLFSFFRINKEKNNYLYLQKAKLNILMRVFNRATRGYTMDLTNKMINDDTKIEELLDKKQLWLLASNHGIFGCIITDNLDVAIQTLSECISEICVLMERAADAWYLGSSESLWHSIYISKFNLRICFRKNFKTMNKLGDF